MQSQCFCQAELTTRNITHVMGVHGKPYIFENVPARVCDQCGEVFFSGDVYDMILHAVQGKVEPSGTMQVDVFDLAMVNQSA
jgi:HTH-type transcriptional regulator/antitoxin MqsA